MHYMYGVMVKVMTMPSAIARRVGVPIPKSYKDLCSLRIVLSEAFRNTIPYTYRYTRDR